MGRANLMLTLPLFVFFFSTTCSSSFGLGLTSLPLDPAVRLHGHRHSKLERVVAGQGGGGGSGGHHTPGNGGTGSNSSPYVQGGAAVIPIYTAGSHPNAHRNNHHGAGSSVQCNCWGSTAIAAFLLAYLLRDMNLFVGW